MKILTFALTMRRMGALPRILLLIARLGGNVTYLSAADGRATIVVTAAPNVAHRFAPQLRRVIDVTELMELRIVGAAPVDGPAALVERKEKRA